MTQVDLAARTGLSTKHINQIIQGVAAVTPETALLLEHATRTPARVWNNLEVAYREHLSRAAEAERLTADVDWLDELPVKQLVTRRLIKKCSSPVDQLREVCTFFGVADRSAWETLWHKPTAYRTSKAFASHPGALAAGTGRPFVHEPPESWSPHRPRGRTGADVCRNPWASDRLLPGQGWNAPPGICRTRLSHHVISDWRLHSARRWGWLRLPTARFRPGLGVPYGRWRA